MTDQDRYLAAKSRLTKAKAAYSAAESELVWAEREMSEASRGWDIYKMSNDYIKKLQPGA